ncbi:MAG: HAMP domain-containing histidine kinase [Oscillospiraceae bacterium]|jgi:signal transduction histidine kinase|nr:HAMP domain-containing histidine kinase [Oscillospiraceae bacterium]
MALALRGLRLEGPLSGYILCAAGLYGACVAVGELTVGRFEPIRGAWPEEYGGFALVVGFAALMAHRDVRLARENHILTFRLQHEVDRKTQALQTLLMERRELLGNVIHDVKNPLSAVRSYAELVRRGNIALDGETTAYLDALFERLGVVETRFDQLQDFSRGERGPVFTEKICLNEYLYEFYERNCPDMELSGQDFFLRLPSQRVDIRGDEERLRTALENLCYNAVSFTPEDGLVTLSLSKQGTDAVITVKDTGCGIAEEDVPYVFQRGFTRRGEDGGEGLGLYIVRTTALEHGGDVEVTSELGKGSIFTLRLPLAEPDE